MIRFSVSPPRAPMWAILALGLGLFVGCAGDDPEAAGTPLEDPGVLLQEPVQGLPDAPPFSAPRDKLTPGEHVDEQEAED